MSAIKLQEQTGDEIDIYAVGVLYELGIAYNAARLNMWHEAWNRLRRIPGMWGRRNSWNGYLAEPLDSGRCTRAGHGWTRRRALADLRQHMREIGQ